jgi:hypothetical protein
MEWLIALAGRVLDAVAGRFSRKREGAQAARVELYRDLMPDLREALRGPYFVRAAEQVDRLERLGASLTKAEQVKVGDWRRRSGTGGSSIGRSC